jgi:excisionase family DNA binding protein
MPKPNPAEMKAMLAEKPVLISRLAAAHRLGVTPRSVDRAVRNGTLRMVKVGGRAMIVRATVDALLAQ